MKNVSVIQKASPFILTGIICGCLALIQAAAAPAAPLASPIAIPRSDRAQAALSRKTRHLLRTTAVRLGKTVRSAAAKPSSKGESKVKSEPALRPTGPARAAKPGLELGGSLPVISATPEQQRIWLRGEDLTEQGDQFARRGQWDSATEAYAGALAISPTDPTALYGIAACAGAAGDVRDEIVFYRHAVYSNSPSEDDGYGFRENNYPQLMKFALVLIQAGQDAEALNVYRRAVVLFDYEDGKPNPGLPVLLPQIGPGGATYTPQRLQALAEVTLALQLWGKPEKQLPLLRDAVRLAPDSVAANYYLGSVEDGTRQWTSARAHYERAAQLGDASTRAAVAKVLRSLPPLK